MMYIILLHNVQKHNIQYSYIYVYNRIYDYVMAIWFCNMILKNNILLLVKNYIYIYIETEKVLLYYKCLITTDIK